MNAPPALFKHWKMSDHEKNVKLTDSVSSADNNNRIEGKVDYDQGMEGSMILFTLICTNLPIGTVVGFKAEQPGPNPPIELYPTTVVTYPSFATGIQCSVPAQYRSVIVYYAELKQAPPPGASLRLQAAYPVNG